VNPKVLLAEGFAFGKERLDVYATLSHRRPLEAHLSRAVGQQGTKPHLRLFCDLETISIKDLTPKIRSTFYAHLRASPSRSKSGSLEAERCRMYFSDSRVSGFSGEHRSSEVQNELSYGFALC